jgi:pSer/pThr/pTyr-binding forkhead associated (FHA) protein/DNA-binding beta-propeller fold protein YncE
MASARLRVLTGPMAGTEIEISGEAVIGRSAPGALALGGDTRLSRRHARLWLEGDVLRVEDAGSTNGTMVNDARLTVPAELHRGDTIHAGDTDLEVVDVPAVTPAEASPPVVTRVSEPAPVTAVEAPAWVPPFTPPRVRRRADLPARRHWFSAVVIVCVTAVLVAASLAWNRAAPMVSHIAGIDGTLYLESNGGGKTHTNTLLAARYHSGLLTPLHIDGYDMAGKGAADLGDRGVLDADSQIVLTPDRTRLFAVNQGSDSIAAFRVADDGTLTAVAGSPFPSDGLAPTSLAVSGSILVVANKAHDGVRELSHEHASYVTFRILGDGGLSRTGSKIEVPPQSSPTQVQLSADGRLVFTTEETDVLRVLSLDGDGHLGEINGSPFSLPNSVFPNGRPSPVWPAGLSVNGSELYTGVPNDNSVLALGIGPDGRLSVDDRALDPAAKLPCWSVVNKEHNHLYFADAGSDSITVWDVGNARRPALLQHFDMTGGGNPWNLTLDPQNNHLYVITPRQVSAVPAGEGQLLHSLVVGLDGKLSEPQPPLSLPVPLGSNVVGLVIVPDR